MNTVYNYLNDHILYVLLSQRGFERTKLQIKEMERLKSIYDLKAIRYFDICETMVSAGYMDKSSIEIDNKKTIKYKTNEKGIKAIENFVFLSETQELLSLSSQKRTMRSWTIINGIVTLIIAAAGGILVPFIIASAEKGDMQEKINTVKLKIDSVSLRLNNIDNNMLKNKDSVIINKK